MFDIFSREKALRPYMNSFLIKGEDPISILDCRVLTTKIT